MVPLRQPALLNTQQTFRVGIELRRLAERFAAGDRGAIYAIISPTPQAAQRCTATTAGPAVNHLRTQSYTHCLAPSRSEPVSGKENRADAQLAEFPQGT